MILTENQVLLLRIIAELNHWRSKAHYATDTGIKKILSNQISTKSSFFRKWRKKGLSPLKTNNLVIEHSTGGDITYELTKKGLNIAYENL